MTAPHGPSQQDATSPASAGHSREGLQVNGFLHLFFCGPSSRRTPTFAGHVRQTRASFGVARRLALPRALCRLVHGGAWRRTAVGVAGQLASLGAGHCCLLGVAWRRSAALCARRLVLLSVASHGVAQRPKALEDGQRPTAALLALLSNAQRHGAPRVVCFCLECLFGSFSKGSLVNDSHHTLIVG